MNRSLIVGMVVGFAVGVAVVGGLRHGISARGIAAAPDEDAAQATTTGKAANRIYLNTLRPIENARPLLADYPEYVQPVEESRRYESPPLLVDDNADLDVRAWRFSYNLRGIVEVPHRLQAKKTAVIVVHPWSVDDEWGWKTPEPHGAVDFCTPEKNALAYRHTRDVIDPFLKRLRPRVGLVMYSLIGGSDPIRKRAYRTIHGEPSADEQTAGKEELRKLLASHAYRGRPLPDKLQIGSENPVRDYFRQFPGLDAGDHYNGPGFWKLPIAVSTAIETVPTDVLIFDDDGYPPLRAFLKQNGIRHILLTGYATDMCFCRTTAGYENLSRDFNVFLVGDATLATFPANSTPKYATNAHISFASINHFITQVQWVK